MVAARSGCRCFTMRRQSAQLDQWAAGRTRDALVSPHPPKDSDKDERTCATGGCPGSAQNFAQTPPHLGIMPGSKTLREFWPDSSQPEVSPRRPAHQQQEPCSLGVLDPRDPLKQLALCLTLPDQKRFDVLRLADGNSQHLQPLQIRWQRWVPLPHHCLGLSIRALAVRTSTPSGAIPARFHTWVLP